MSCYFADFVENKSDGNGLYNVNVIKPVVKGTGCFREFILNTCCHSVPELKILHFSKTSCLQMPYRALLFWKECTIYKFKFVAIFFFDDGLHDIYSCANGLRLCFFSSQGLARICIKGFFSRGTAHSFVNFNVNGDISKEILSSVL